MSTSLGPVGTLRNALSGPTQSMATPPTAEDIQNSLRQIDPAAKAKYLQQNQPVVPLPNDAAVQRAAKKKASLVALTGGRASTILTGPESLSGDRLGG